MIGSGKIVTAVMLLAAGIGIFHYMDHDLGKALEHFVGLIRLDPDSRVIHTILTKVAGIDRRHLREIGLGTFFYAATHLVEGTGLLLRRPWAEYLTIFVTGSLVPIEGAMAIKRVDLPKLFVLGINVLIVVYLVVKLRQGRRMMVSGAVHHAVVKAEPLPGTSGPG